MKTRILSLNVDDDDSAVLYLRTLAADATAVANLASSYARVIENRNKLIDPSLLETQMDADLLDALDTFNESLNRVMNL